jgi:hypothetical protein
MRTSPTFRSAVRGFYAWLGSLVMLGVAPIAARELAERESLLPRIAAVLVAVIGVLPWMWVIWTAVRRGDEFIRRMHLVAATFAFAGAQVLLVGLAWLVRAGFMAPPDLMLLWVAFLVLWVVAILGTKLYFERER